MVLSRHLAELILVLSTTTGALAASCEALVKLSLPNTTLTHAQHVSGGKFTPPGQPALENLPEFCRVSGVIKPSSDSNIQFEVWMPVAGWNGKFQGVGNGGFAGSINYGRAGLAGALKRGFATASTDTGHTSTGIDATWALDHPEKIVDFGYRAIHEMTAQAKSIVAAFYGSPPEKSYFASCSNGGRQALMEAQRYPDDYDGIIAGAPANDWSHLLLGFIWNSQALNKDPSRRIPPSKLPAIEAAVLAACDSQDGVKDGVLDDPTKCAFNPERLKCEGVESDSCLTSGQIAALKDIYTGPKFFPGFEPGAQTGAGGWTSWILGPQGGDSLQFAFGTQFLKNMALQDSKYDYLRFDFDRNMKAVDAKMAPVLSAIDPDLSKFRSRGGKLILFHGWNDAAIPARSTINYYKDVAAKMGAQQADSFVRLYMVPGMQHCGGGPGPNTFGVYGEGKGEMATALERWVENGKAPDTITATKFTLDGDPSSAPARTRPLCPYPQVARYKGSGVTDVATSFECASPSLRK